MKNLFTVSVGIVFWMCCPCNGFTQTKEKVTELKEVTINTRKQAVERKTDRIVVNVSALTSTAGGNALEVLEQVPGIIVSSDQIILKGKQNVLIFIDNRPVYLEGNDLADYLKSLPAGLLDKIEVMTNPPAQYEASGNGGIINIRLKKGKATGFNGNVLSENTQGKYSRIGQTVNFNYRTEKSNVFGNLSNYNGAGVSEFTSKRTYPAGSSLASVLQSRTVKVPNDRIMAKLGLDLYLTPKTVAGAAVSYLYRDTREEISSRVRQQYWRQVPDTLLNADNRTRNLVNTTTFNLNIQHTYDTTGKAWTGDLDLINYDMNYGLVNKSHAFTESGPQILHSNEDLKGRLPSRIRIYSAKTDYVLPFNKESKIEMGLKSSFINNGISSSYTTSVDQVRLPEYDRSGQFKYEEQINAAYLNYNQAYKKFSFQLGLRVEYTTSKGRQLGSAAAIDSTFNRRYLDLFPTMFLSYKFDQSGDHVLNLNFGKRIDRPNYQDLNPFASPRDRYNYDIGNPYLKPQLSYNYELSYMLKKIFTFSVFYNHLKDGIDETIQVKNNVFYRRPDNIGQKQLSGFSADCSIPLTSWWLLNPNMLFTHTDYKTLIDKENLQVKGNNWSLSVSQQFNLKKGWNIEVMGNYTSAQVYAQFIEKENWYLHAGVGKKLLNNRGIIKLNARDLFYTRLDQQDFTGLKGVSGYSRRKWDTRNITLSLAYRFEKGKSASRLRKTDKNQESKRLGEL